MSSPFARVSTRIASTLFALVALVFLGFATSPGGVSAMEAHASQTIQEDDQAAPSAGDEGVAASLADGDDTHPHDAVTPSVWGLSPLAGTSFAASRASLGSASRLQGPDRPPPRAGSDSRSGPVGIL